MSLPRTNVDNLNKPYTEMDEELREKWSMFFNDTFGNPNQSILDRLEKIECKLDELIFDRKRRAILDEYERITGTIIE